jgi:hypothetical protein
MAPTIITEVGQLASKEMIAELYFKSLGNIETRKSHLALVPALVSGGSPPAPTASDMQKDFTAWYGGLTSLAQAIDPAVALPDIRDMNGLINSQLDRGKKALAA